MTRYICVDTETTGLNHKVDRIVEYAATEFDPKTGIITRKQHMYFNPEKVVIPPEVSKIHGLTNDRLKTEPLFVNKADEIVEFLSGSVLVIHNAKFDLGFFKEELKRACLASLDTYVVDVIDTLSVSRQLLRPGKHTLDRLCDIYNVDRSSRTNHGALLDCELLAAVYPFLAADLTVQISRLNTLLPFDVSSELPDSAEGLADRSLMLAELENYASRLRAKVNDKLKKVVDGMPQSGDGWEVEFQPRVTTDWKKITAKFLVGVDLAPFKTDGSAMYVKWKEAD